MDSGSAVSGVYSTSSSQQSTAAITKERTMSIIPSTATNTTNAIRDEEDYDSDSTLSILSRSPSPPPALNPNIIATSSPNRTKEQFTSPEATFNQQPPSTQACSLDGTEDLEAPQKTAKQPQTDIQAQQQVPVQSNINRQVSIVRKLYSIECMHTRTCACPMHASHPSVRPAADLPASGQRQYSHLSEYALAAQEWPVSGLRSTL